MCAAEDELPPNLWGNLAAALQAWRGLDPAAVRRLEAGTLGELFGAAPRPASVDPGWLTSSVTGLAESLYRRPAFDVMPILADALEDAGCSDELVLAHCRGGGRHVRRCWVIDMLLGKV